MRIIVCSKPEVSLDKKNLSFSTFLYKPEANLFLPGEIFPIGGRIQATGYYFPQMKIRYLCGLKHTSSLKGCDRMMVVSSYVDRLGCALINQANKQTFVVLALLEDLNCLGMVGTVSLVEVL